MKERVFIEDGKMVTHLSLDIEPLLNQNMEERLAQPKACQYKGKTLVKVASFSETDVNRLKNLGYNLLSPDPEEVKRALLYVQQNERYFLTVNGTPFAKKKTWWE